MTKKAQQEKDVAVTKAKQICPSPQLRLDAANNLADATVARGQLKPTSFCSKDAEAEPCVSKSSPSATATHMRNTSSIKGSRRR